MGDDASVSIRQATSNDVATLQSLFAAHFGTDDLDEKVVRHRERLGRLIDAPGHHILVAERDGAVIGYAAAQDYGPAGAELWSIARMHDLWISPDARGLGAGLALFEATRDWAIEKTQIRFLQWQSSRVAVDFYRKLGLTEEGEGGHFALAVNLPATD